MATISTRISLEGAAEVEKQLADIGKAGDEAFAELGKTSAEAADGIAKVGESSEKTAAEIGKVDTQAQQAAESVKSLSLETVKTSLEIAKVTAEIAKLGVEIGLAVARHRTLAETLVHLASGASTAVRAIGLIAPELTALGAVLAPVAGVVAGAVIGFEALEKAATKAASGYEKLSNSLQKLASNSGQSFDSLQRGQAAFGQLGINAESFAGTITKISEALKSLNVGDELKKSTQGVEEAVNKVLAAEKALIEARLKAQGREPSLDEFVRLLEIEREMKKTAGEVAVAEQNLAAARQQAAAATANSLQTVLDLVKQIEAGQKGLKFDELVTADSKIKAVAASMKEAADAGQTAGRVLIDFIANADRLSAIQVGAKFGITEEEVDRIRRLGGDLKVVDDIWKRLQTAGVLIPPDSAAAFERMRTSIDEAGSAWERLKQSFQSPAIATEAAKISGDLNIIKSAVLNFAAATVEAFGRAGAGMAQGMGASIETTKQEINAIFNLLQKLVGIKPAAAAEPGAKQPAEADFGPMIAAAEVAAEKIKQIFANVFSQLVQVIDWSKLGEGLDAVLAELVQKAEAAGQKIAGALKQEGGTSEPPVDPEQLEIFNEAADDLVRTINKVVAALAQFNETPTPAVAQEISQGVESIANQLPRVQGIADALKLDPSIASEMDGIKAKIVEILEAAKQQENLFRPAAISAEEAGRQISSAFSNSRTEVSNFATSLSVINFSSIVTAAQTAASQVGQAFSSSLAAVGLTIDFSSMRNAAQTVATEIQLLFSTAGQQIAAEFSNLDISSALSDQINSLITLFDQLADSATNAAKASQSVGSGSSGGAPAPAPGAPFARGGLLGGRGTGTSDSNLAWLSRGEYIMPARAVRQPGVLAFLEALRRWGKIPGFAAGGSTGGASIGGGGSVKILVEVDKLVDVINLNTEAIESQSDVIIDLGNMVASLADQVSGLAQTVGNMGQAQGKARGGLLGGRGTGTSDSNLAWLSRGEHIMPARAVGQPGVLAFLEALRRSGGNLRAVLDGMGRFALGGMVPRAIPAFATGGLAGGMSNVTIAFPGLPPISGLRASSDVVDQLHRAAALAQVRSGGRKPSRYS